jgi:serine protease AprX
MARSRSKNARRARPATPATGADAAARTKQGFLPEVLDSSVIAVPLHRRIQQQGTRVVLHVIIDLNLEFPGGVRGARAEVERLIPLVVTALRKDPKTQRVHRHPLETEEGGEGAPADGQYVVATLDGDCIRELVRRDDDGAGRRAAARAKRAIYHIWPDFDLTPLIDKSVTTVKADAAHNAFSAFGADVVWAIVDSGIDGWHPHFYRHQNLVLAPPLRHRDFTSDGGDALFDKYGHGTHVAGIVAGQLESPKDGTIRAARRHRDERDQPVNVPVTIGAISGMAPRCKLLSLKVLDADGRGNGTGRASSIIAALQYVHRLNGYGRRILVHGVNLSVGYDFEPEWFACGQSPLCVEVDRLVKSGVVVVVAAGNSGYGYEQTAHQGTVAAGMDLTINDPGNADLAITVGSTHRDSPHVYGVSYFSSKGPTGDGRMKPDLLAPGEKIISCDSSRRPGGPGRPARGSRSASRVGNYREDSGTSMAAPHVSGVIAAFLSIRREFIGQTEAVKRIFLNTATDLQRAPYFQGRGLVDLMRAIQSV